MTFTSLSEARLSVFVVEIQGELSQFKVVPHFPMSPRGFSIQASRQFAVGSDHMSHIVNHYPMCLSWERDRFASKSVVNHDLRYSRQSSSTFNRAAKTCLQGPRWP